MLIGPVFTRELVTAPRRLRFYVAPAVYVGGLLILSSTAWLLLTGTQQIRNVGDTARFGATLFQFLAPLQLVLAIFFSALASASAVAQEKDRRTLILLLLTNLSNTELVLGKLLASLLNVLLLLAAAVPFFMLTALLGGVSFHQIFNVFAVTVISAIAAGSLGSTIALWREKTFQTLALTALLLGILAAWEVLVAAGAIHGSWQGVPLSRWIAGFSPWHAVLSAAKPHINAGHLPWFGSAVRLYFATAALFALVVNLMAIGLVRVWNPSREARPRTEDADEFRTAETGVSVHAAPGKARRVWDNPILWREVRTWAYGRKVLVVRLVYLALCAAAVLGIQATLTRDSSAQGSLPVVVAPFFVLSLVLLNALAVTSITTERDLGRTRPAASNRSHPLRIHPRQALGRVLRRQRNAPAAPGHLHLLVVGRCNHLRKPALRNRRTRRDGSLRRHPRHPRRLGLHQQPHRRRRQPGHRLLPVRRRGRLHANHGLLQRLLPNAIGPLPGLHVRRQHRLVRRPGARNPSQAIGLASLLLPVLTFVAITGFLQGETLGVFLVVAFTYGLTTTAMLVPAISEFDVATGRTTE